MWGQFPTITQVQQRNFVRNYWRYLLGWGPRPVSDGMSQRTCYELRAMATAEVEAARQVAISKEGASIYEFKAAS